MSTDHSRFCGRCGNPVQEGEAFCGNCGMAVMPSPEEAEQVIPREEAASHGGGGAARRRRSSRMLALAVGLGALVVLLVGGGALTTLAFGDRLGLTGASGTPPAETVEPAERDAGVGEATSPPALTPESAPEPEETPVYSSDPGADPAFERILSTLQDTTSAIIVLPSELPAFVADVAIDADMEGDEGYRILFLNDAADSDEVVQQYVNAYVNGTLEATLITGGGPQFSEPGPDYQEVSSGSVETLDGISANYRCYDTEVGVTGPHCTGGYLRPGWEAGQSYLYVITLEGETSPEEEMRRILSSMLTLMVQDGPEEANLDDAQAFVSEYYEAVGRKDWRATYSMLDAESRAAFTEEEWVGVQERRDSAQDTGSTQEARVDGVHGGGATVTLYYEDGAAETLDIELYYEEGDLRRHLTQEEIDFLRSL